MSAADAGDMDRLVAGAHTRLELLRHSREDLDRIRATATSSNRLVVVVADGTGTMVDLHLADDLGSLSARALSEAIVSASAQAARGALEQREAILESLHGFFTDS